ncbi:MAG TPA: hypothetical protein VK760_14115 [Candidatus Acidoferrales bacterium]|jgi:hypothetical protein|nr:hypothetical protein [Candidatus Acidoferrales bacterium]
MLSRKGLLVLGVLACVAASCSSGTVTSPAGPVTEPPAVANACANSTPPPSRSAGAGRRAVVAKQPLRGLIDLGQVSADNMPEPPYNTIYFACQRKASISGIVVNDTWESLQPGGEGAPLDTRTIDAALQTIAAYDQTQGRTLGVRLRVWAGINAPGWAKSIGGSPIAICDGTAVPASPPPSDVASPASPTPCPAAAIRTVGPFWSSAYESAWRNVQIQLAKKYDGNPIVNEVSVSSCSSLTSEPFVQPEDAFSRRNMIAAGYTDALYQTCLANAIPLDYAIAWRSTIVDYSFNPLRKIDVTPPQTDLAFSEGVMRLCRKALKARCALLDEALAKFTPPPSPLPSQTPSTAQNYYAMWNYMESLGGEITFQTASPPNLLAAWGTNAGGWNAAIDLAHQFGASSVELFPQKSTGSCTDPPSRLWVDGYTCFSAGTMLRWKSIIDGGS